MIEADKRQQKIEKLASAVMKNMRNTLLINMRYIDFAIGRLPAVQIKDPGYRVDGEFIYYNPKDVLKSYREHEGLPARHFLHMLFHCIYLHFYIDTLIEQEYWDLACDIAAEHSINLLRLSYVCDSRSHKQEEIIAGLKANVKYITAEVIYRYFLDGNVSSEELNSWKKIFKTDDHACWYIVDEEEDRATDENAEHGDSSTNKGMGDSDGSMGLSEKRRRLRKEWANVSKRVKFKAQTSNNMQGNSNETFMQDLMEVNNEKYDYRAFLKKFAVMGEAMQINDDEFDYIFYTYGMKMYGKMPLIEPLEYKEVMRIREFVIAIDTSSSTSGDLVQKFVQKTYNILKQTESFFSKINVHIIQCGASIREEAKITSREEFENYIKNMSIMGQKGTDFRPVFAHVNELVKNKEFTNLKGLIYFTDGFGQFPEEAPDYKTAFIYMDGEVNNPDVPPWATKLILKPEEI